MQSKYAVKKGQDMSYEAKPDGYFDGTRYDFIRLLPENKQGRILEIGCGFGETGTQALKDMKCAAYIGVELSDRAAKIASHKLTKVLHGNIETMTLDFEPQSFDVLIMSEVLEHLVDPWATLRRLHPFIKTGGKVLASSPNMSHHSVIRRLLRGDWTLADSGVMDRTHLRWFTPKSYASMFQDTGFQVKSVKPVRAFGRKASLINWLTGNKLSYLFMNQICIQAERL
jgi:2-polyprenyl-3-methyl-5-hydroxy-6-metoxy-1,4-benzoquinol methylase